MPRSKKPTKNARKTGDNAKERKVRGRKIPDHIQALLVKEEELGYEVSSGNVFLDIGFEPQEAASLLLKSHLMIEITGIIEKNGWTQAHAARVLGIAQPRISELAHGNMDRFSVDSLIEYLWALGKTVTFRIKNIPK